MKIVRSIYHIFRNILDNSKASFFAKKDCSFLKDKICSELFISHNFGGGTRTYEKNYLNNKKNVCIIRNVRGFKTKYLRITYKDEDFSFYIKTSYFSYLLECIKPQEITINSLVSYTNCFDILKIIEKYLNNHKTYTRYMIHDFHCVCPKFDLISGANYCELKCDRNNCDINIQYWRDNWQVLLNSINEIRVFCNSSKEIIKKVYPALPDEKFAFVPHDMSYCHFLPYKIRFNENTRIAFVGTCNTIAKGNEIINKFIKQYDKKEILILGNTPLSKENRNKKNVIQFGKYNNEELPYILEEYNVNIVIFPSIWPETFSYIISELIKTGVSIISFNIGAQGEKIKKYDKGYLCEDITTDSIILKLDEVK